MEKIISLIFLSFLLQSCFDNKTAKKINTYQASYDDYQKICLKEVYQLAKDPEIKNFVFEKKPLSTWPGVRFIDEEKGQITHLDLSKKIFIGTLPSCIKNLRNLEIVHLDDQNLIKVDFVEASQITVAPWSHKDELTPPKKLPEGWSQHKADKDLFIIYLRNLKRIKKRSIYYKINGKIAVGWHGSVNPPHGM